MHKPNDYPPSLVARAGIRTEPDLVAALERAGFAVITEESAAWAALLSRALREEAEEALALAREDVA